MTAAARNAALDPVACALFLLCAFTLAGLAQTAWFRSAWSRPFMVPIDAGRMMGGRRLFGDNKTIRGFVGMVPAAAAAFALLTLLVDPRSSVGLWPLSALQYAALGAWAGFGFMAGELPNSFVKRRLGIAPGETSPGRSRMVAQFLVDRLDSGVGMLAAVSAVVPVPALTWMYVLSFGPPIHWSFSLLMFRLRIKERPA